MPILIEHYGLRPDSGGAGRYRGGCGIELTVRVFAPDTVMTARGMERMHFRPWGRLGGLPGENGVAVKNLGTPAEEPTGRIDELLLQPGDTVTFLSQGGGGYGDPYERDAEQVRVDVRRGLVSAEAARTRYGVDIVDGCVDTAATLALRGSRKPHRTPFVFGPERDAFEAVWTDELQVALNRSLMRYTPGMRNYLKQRTMAEVDARVRAQRATSPAEITDLVHGWFERATRGRVARPDRTPLVP